MALSSLFTSLLGYGSLILACSHCLSGAVECLWKYDRFVDVLLGGGGFTTRLVFRIGRVDEGGEVECGGEADAELPEDDEEDDDERDDERGGFEAAADDW